MMHSGQHKDNISDIKTDDSYGGLVVTVCWVILLYEARVANSSLGNYRFGVWTAVMDLWQGSLIGILRAFM